MTGIFGLRSPSAQSSSPIAMTITGPDMDRVEELVKDPAVKGIWCVPKYSNPDGIVYSPDTIRRLAGLRPAAPDFVLMWDNAYCVHEFDGPHVPFPDILGLCREAGNPDMVFEFASTSKITLPGAGMSVMAASEANLQYMQKLMGVQMISYDKVNQLRQVLYLRDKEHTLEIMAEHGRILKPKFQMVLDTLERELAPRELGHWQRPKGRLLRLLLCTCRDSQAHAGAVQGGGRGDDCRRRYISLRRGPP